MVKLPFLRRARAVRWQITLSNTSYGMLCQFLRSTGAGVDDTSLLAMSTLLQTKCELHIERRDPSWPGDEAIQRPAFETRPEN